MLSLVVIFFAFIYKNRQGDVLQGLLFCIFFSTILLVKQLEKKSLGQLKTI